MDMVRKYFPDLTVEQYEQLGRLGELYNYWNARVNVISRKDLDNFYERHVLHSLAIAKVINFKPNTKILDVGTGGGFPGIPLAILFPKADFVLVDSIGKKIKVVNEVVEALGLKNVTAEQQRAEKVRGNFDFVVSRAVTRMNRFVPWVKKKFKSHSFNDLPNGIIYLKGGDLNEELNEVNFKHKPTIYNITEFFEGDFFETKKVVHVRMN